MAFNAASKTVSFYQNGAIAKTATSQINAATGVTSEAARCFSVGAEYNDGSVACAGAGSVVDGFNGTISDVRVWEAARSAANILANYEQRLALSGTVTNLVVNWKLDIESGMATNAANTPSSYGTNGTLAGTATYTPTLALYFRPFANTVCPNNYVGPYECDFRLAIHSDDIQIPSNLGTLYAEVWGGGGGGHSDGTNSSAGGGGGFSSARIEYVGTATTTIANAFVDVVVGGGGTGSGAAASNDHIGGAGAGASGLRITAARVILVAGGGAGAGYSDLNTAGTGNCSTVVGTANQCGLGGGGGGAGGTAGALTTRAPDQGQAGDNCGGRGGDNTPSGAVPPNSGGGGHNDCTEAGNDPSTTTGGSGAGTAAGGSSYLGAGGAGSDASAGGSKDGGGGVSAVNGSGIATAGGGEAGGIRQSSDNQSWGGGGGSGYADSFLSHVTGTAAVAAIAGTAANATVTDYAPSYATSVNSAPGKGGTSGGTGKDGAVVLKW